MSNTTAMRIVSVALVGIVAAPLLSGCGGGSNVTACAHEYVIENTGYRWWQAAGWQRAEAVRVCRAHPHDATWFGPGSR